MGHLLSDPLAGRVAWALIHFLWQGAAIAALLALVLRMRGMHSPQRRYALSVASLVLMPLCPLATALEYRLQPVLNVSTNSLKAGLQPPIATVDLPTDISMSPTAVWQPYLLAAWMAGVLLLACRLLAG